MSITVKQFSLNETIFWLCVCVCVNVVCGVEGEKGEGMGVCLKSDCTLLFAFCCLHLAFLFPVS